MKTERDKTFGPLYTVASIITRVHNSLPGFAVCEVGPFVCCGVMTASRFEALSPAATSPPNSHKAVQCRLMQSWLQRRPLFHSSDMFTCKVKISDIRKQISLDAIPDTTTNVHAACRSNSRVTCLTAMCETQGLNLTTG